MQKFKVKIEKKTYTAIGKTQYDAVIRLLNNLGLNYVNTKFKVIEHAK